MAALVRSSDETRCGPMKLKPFKMSSSSIKAESEMESLWFSDVKSESKLETSDGVFFSQNPKIRKFFKRTPQIQKSAYNVGLVRRLHLGVLELGPVE